MTKPKRKPFNETQLAIIRAVESDVDKELDVEGESDVDKLCYSDMTERMWTAFKDMYKEEGYRIREPGDDRIVIEHPGGITKAER